MIGGMQVINGVETSVQLLAKAKGLDEAVAGLVTHWATLLNTKIKAKASGRPGPNAPTGDYRRSWTTEITRSGGTTSGVVGTNKPQGRRLEYGFVGTDSLGRVYNQPPFAHVGPAADEIGPQMIKAYNGLVKAL